MGVQDLQTFLESSSVPGGTVNVELLKVARSVVSKQNGRNKKQKESLLGGPQMFSLVVDAECCIDRLYGGFFSDWVSGGEWKRMVQFLSVLIETVQTGKIDLVFFFNGSLESERMQEWVATQLKARQNINLVLKHINSKGTPPPKVWWVPPTGLRTALRMAMRHHGLTTVTSMDDHRQETIAYLRENSLHGLVADDAEYAVFDPPRYFSASNLKLTYKGMVETREYQLSQLAKSLDLPRERFCLLAALLGNYMLTEQDLSEFYTRLGLDSNSLKPDALVKAVALFVKTLDSSDNLDFVATQVFGTAGDKRSAKLKQCVQYYMNGTKEGFLNYRPPSAHNADPNKSKKMEPVPNEKVNGVNENGENSDLDTSKFASETQESEQESLAAYNEATAALNLSQEIDSETPSSPATKENGIHEEQKEEKETLENGTVNGTSQHLPSDVTPSACSGTITDKEPYSQDLKPLPPVPPEVMRTASERHQKGLMSPYICQILSHGEIMLPMLMEDETHKDLPSIHSFYRPVRQMVYAILFNLHHHKYLANKSKKEKDCTEKTEVPDLVIKEWLWSKSNQYQSPDLVRAEEIGWAVPTIQRLWFGSTIDDKRRRLRAFLTCMRSDNPLILNTSYVPQHLLVLACVLRYIMSSPEKILRKHELDAIITQAVSPELMDIQYLQELQLPMVTSRGVQLATLLLAGVETALLVNDACGAPVPWLMCCPWLYIDGKLLQHTLAHASACKNLRELCGHRLDQAVKVERLRQAVLEGLDVQFARNLIPPLSSAAGPIRMMTSGMIPGASGPVGRGAGRGGILRRPVPPGGGQLEVAGLVVSSWGANYGSRSAHPVPPLGSYHPGLRPMPQMMPNMRTYRMPMNDFNGMAGPRSHQRPLFQTRGTGSKVIGRGKKGQVIKKKSTVPPSGTKRILNNEKRTVKGRGMTVEVEDASGITAIPAADLIEKSVAAISDQFEDLSVNGEKKDCNDEVHQEQGDDAVVVN
ncbi:constitutive coactivator of PPAR-gamma-like protein 1 homolog [Thrips palmi]|uniref:Constitutive coactivator of PPAR-gamma-like protein 1 homolog n=1 Tax=Thrips palmi TaxID=161013 RepID=A0A6P8ZN82_THRPL|nr:constitutive coactivator of PPAR-gamma-like protein 1 homolog [Thrips palmi]XP_034241899.1 constitutive coactivator of PPAR-gamma-like protein 1 homolog [Thrips palmi]XP_034241900.1 constitutive coactivator of PPAR-gamma-like protein 1 homolog [Thrips palmi]XP_034241901.1 constitutive coactivator of PPAR-gamma-like protein 1 homolog [Thrips palmi]